MTEQAVADALERPQPQRWLAVLLTFVSPGLGHAYAGELLRALVIVVVIAFGIQPLLALYGRTATLAALIGVIAGGLAIYAAVAVDAARISSRSRRRLFTRSAVFFGCLGFLVIAMSIDVAGGWFRDNWIAKSSRIPSAAMIPTLMIGDYFYIDPRAYADREPARGDIVVFSVARDGSKVLPLDRNPDLPAETFTKRIVGLPGDTIRFDGAALYVNGEEKTEAVSTREISGPRGEALLLRTEVLDAASYVVADDPGRDSQSGKPFVVEADRYFVSGDNRDHSNDSRYWGTVHRDDIVGRVTKLYWSWDFNGTWIELLNPSTWWTLLRERTRWDRIGQPVE